MAENEYLRQTRRFFDDLATKWDSIATHDARKLRLIVDLCGIEPGARLLDIGCGTGAMLGQLLAQQPRELTALDLSPRMLEQAAAKFADSRLRLICADFMEFAEEGFDLALLYSVYPHFADKTALSARVAACLKPGGRFMLAHSEAREIINNRHRGGAAENVSRPLLPAEEEAHIWRAYFSVDIIADTEQFYLISGKRR